MIALTYGGALLLSIACMVMLDARFRLVLWRDTARSTLVLAGGVAFFLVWDVVALMRGFYHGGDSAAMTGLELAPDLPVEELLFITFLCYCTLVIHGLLSVLIERGEEGR